MQDDTRSTIKEFDFERSQAKFERFWVGLARGLTPEIEPTMNGHWWFIGGMLIGLLLLLAGV